MIATKQSTGRRAIDEEPVRKIVQPPAGEAAAGSVEAVRRVRAELPEDIAFSPEEEAQLRAWKRESRRIDSQPL